MSLNIRGFTLLETLLAAAIGSLVLLAATRLLPILQLTVLREMQYQQLESELWRLAATIGKTIQRAGYCRSDCDVNGLWLEDGGSCVITRRDYPTGAGEEYTGYRLRGGAIETSGSAIRCTGSGWGKITDPGSLKITNFQVVQERRAPFAPRLTISLAAKMLRDTTTVQIAHSVNGFNL